MLLACAVYHHGDCNGILQTQIGGTSVINYSYTDFPFKLLLKDVHYFFVYCWGIAVDPVAYQALRFW